MGNNWAPLVADLVWFCYERGFILFYLAKTKLTLLEQLTLTQVLNNIDKPHFDQMVCPIYPTELQLNRANSFHTEAPF